MAGEPLDDALREALEEMAASTERSPGLHWFDGEIAAPAKVALAHFG